MKDLKIENLTPETEILILKWKKEEFLLMCTWLNGQGVELKGSFELLAERKEGERHDRDAEDNAKERAFVSEYKEDPGIKKALEVIKTGWEMRGREIERLKEELNDKS